MRPWAPGRARILPFIYRGGTLPETDSRVLARIGWNDDLQLFLEALNESLEPARVIAEHRGSYTVATARGEMRATLLGSFRHHAESRSQLPVVGDWVGCR